MTDTTQKKAPKKMVKKKMRELLRMDKDALWTQFQDMRKLSKKFGCATSFFMNPRYGPAQLKKLGWTKREIAHAIREVQQVCINQQPTKEERKYFHGMTMNQNNKTNKTYKPPKNNVNMNNNNVFNKYTNNSNSNSNSKSNSLKTQADYNRERRAYLRNQIMQRFGVDPNKNFRFKHRENWRNYSNISPNAAKTVQYANTLASPGKLAGKKRFGKRGYGNWKTPGVPTTRTGSRKNMANNPAKYKQYLAKRILSKLNDYNWTKNFNNTDKKYAERLVNDYLWGEKRIMTNLVANNILKRFGKRYERVEMAEKRKRNLNYANRRERLQKILDRPKYSFVPAYSENNLKNISNMIKKLNKRFDR